MSLKVITVVHSLHDVPLRITTHTQKHLYTHIHIFNGYRIIIISTQMRRVRQMPLCTIYKFAHCMGEKDRKKNDDDCQNMRIRRITCLLLNPFSLQFLCCSASSRVVVRVLFFFFEEKIEDKRICAFSRE